MKRIAVLSATLVLFGCGQIETTAETESNGQESYIVPSAPENSDHGYLLEDDRIPTIYSCDEWTAFWDQLGPAVSFEVADAFPNFEIAVSTQIFTKNRHLDSDGDGVICFLEYDGRIEVSAEAELLPLEPEISEPKSVITGIEELSEPEECKILQGGKWPEQTTRAGFPTHPDYLMNAGRKIVIQLIAVEAEDMPVGELDIDEAFFRRTEAFLEDVTESKVDFEIRFPREVSLLPREIVEYGLTRTGDVLLFEFLQDSISSADSFIDFSDVDIVVAVPPANVSAMQVAFSPALPLDKNSAFSTKEGKVYRGTVVGQDMRWEEGHLLLAHEIGHLLGLQDYYAFDWRPGDSYQDQFKYLGEFDNMNFAPGKAREWTGWSRFLLGVLDDDQVRCITGQKDTLHKLIPVGSEENGAKIVVIPTGTYTAVVIESRKSIRHDSQFPEQYSGLLVYRVDTSRESGYGPLEIVRRNDIRDPFLIDAPLRVGESMQIDGWTITNVETSPDWDVVQISQN